MAVAAPLISGVESAKYRKAVERRLNFVSSLKFVLFTYIEETFANDGFKTTARSIPLCYVSKIHEQQRWCCRTSRMKFVV